MQTDFLQYIFQAINNLLTQNLGFFDTMGQNLFRSFATILIAWFRNQVRPRFRQRKAFVPVRSFREPAATISFGFAMVNYYSTPIPGIGVQLPQSRDRRSAVPLKQDRSSRASDRCQPGCRL